MLDIADVVLILLLDWIAKGFVILGLVFLADLLLRRAEASLRHLTWVVGLAAVMMLPAVSWMLPSLDVPLFHLGFLSTGSAPLAGLAPDGSRAGFGWSLSEILLGIYAAGLLLVLSWQLVGRAYAFRLRRHADRLAAEGITVELERLKAALGIRNPVQLLCSDLISIPFSTGYLRPVIVLPRATASWPAQILESVLIHELAHIKRRDILTRIAAQLICCIHWINPLAWFGFGRIMMEQEIACDNLVLVAGTKASDYARNLLAMSEMRRGRMDFALTAFGRRTELKHRLLEILRPTRTRAPLRIGGSLVFLSLTLGLFLPISALNFWRASDAGSVLAPPDTALRQAPASPRETLVVRAPGSDARPLPDIVKAKEEISKKIKVMKEQGVPQQEINKFTLAAKAKLEQLQMQKRKQDEEKRKQIEQMKSKQSK